MTGEDLLAKGYTRALWVPSPERYYLRPDGLSVISEEEALRELGELVGGDGDEAPPAAA